MTMEQLDLVVVGAGWYGLAAAKQYYANHPDHSLAILDSAASLGGVWAKARHYPGLKSNNLLGTYEYPDFPMDPATFGVQPGQHIPCEVVEAYQEAYARKFAIFDKVRCNTKVLSAEHKPEGGWVLRITRTTGDEGAVDKGSEVKEIFAKRLIMATGKVSEPFMPRIKGQESYGRPIFHAKTFGQRTETFDPNKRVTVFGGTKFAWDAVYAYASKGVKVNWIIRKSGHGPAWMAPPYVTPLKKWLEKLVNTRMVHWFSPCVWSDDSGYAGIQSFWHGSAVGRSVVSSFWSVLGNDALQLMGYDKHPETAKLKPTTDAFHTGCSFSILNYDEDFLEFIRNGTVNVHLADISHLSSGQVHLDDEDRTALESDALLCVTGWKHSPSIKFLPEGTEAKIGLPYTPGSKASPNGLASQTALLEKADAEISGRFPILTKPAQFNPDYKLLTDTEAFSLKSGERHAPTQPHTAMMLYHFMVPATAEFLRTKDLAFAGAIMNFSNVTCAHIQGLWISAYFDGKLARDPSAAVLPVSVHGSVSGEKDADAKAMTTTLEEVQWETILHNRFGKWRYPNDPGAKSPDFVFEAVPYMDMMMADLGLQVHRKGGWWKEISDAYGPEDYSDINQEWTARYGASEA